MMLFWGAYTIPALITIMNLIYTKKAIKQLNTRGEELLTDPNYKPWGKNREPETRTTSWLYADMFSPKTCIPGVIWFYQTAVSLNTFTTLDPALISAALGLTSTAIYLLLSRGALNKCAVPTLKAIGWGTLICNAVALAVFGVLVATGVLV
jgi:hypothetical protein